MAATMGADTNGSVGCASFTLAGPLSIGKPWPDHSEGTAIVQRSDVRWQATILVRSSVVT